MPRLFSRIPDALQKPATKGLLCLAVACSLVAILLILEFSQTTKTSGHLWWKESREIPLNERLPYLLIGIGLLIVAVVCAVGAIELFSVQAKKAESDLQSGSPSNTSFPFLFARAIRRNAQERHARNAELREAAATRGAEAQEAEARWRYEMSTAGRAEAAFDRGEAYFSIALEVDGDLARHLNEIRTAGWRQESVHYSHRRTTHTNRGYDGSTEVTRETTKYATYLFRRDS